MPERGYSMWLIVWEEGVLRVECFVITGDHTNSHEPLPVNKCSGQRRSPSFRSDLQGQDEQCNR